MKLIYKIYNLQILHNTFLKSLYLQGLVDLLSLLHEGCYSLTARFIYIIYLVGKIMRDL